MNLHKETEAAELLAKSAIVDEATALVRRNTKLLDLEALELDSKYNILCYLCSPSPQFPSMSTPSSDVLGDSWQLYSQRNKQGAQILLGPLPLLNIVKYDRYLKGHLSISIFTKIVYPI